MEVTWFEFKPKNPPKKWKRKMGVYGIDEEKRIWIPAKIVGGMMEVVLCCGYDNTDMIKGPDNELFVPMDWAIHEFRSTPDEVLLDVQQKMQSHHKDIFANG